MKGGQAWAKKVGGVNGSRIFERTVTRKGATFKVQIGEEKIINTVRGLVRDGSAEIKSSDIADVIEKLRQFKKGEVDAKINTIATEVKKRIDKKVDTLINSMMNSGNVNMAVDGIRIVWTNPGAVPLPAPKKPRATKKPAPAAAPRTPAPAPDQQAPSTAPAQQPPAPPAPSTKKTP